MKSLLVPTGGADSDEAVFETALAAARPFAAHLNFVHIHVGAGQAAAHYPHTDFASGAALHNALAELESRAQVRSTNAAQRVRDFCARSKIEMCDEPGLSRQVTADWREEQNDAPERILFHARHNDLVVVARPTRPNGLPADFVENLLLGCGRPVLIAGASPPRALTDTIMVCWKESADAARAVTAATPLLRHAKRVIFASVVDRSDEIRAAMTEVVRQCAWNGIAAETKVIARNGRPPQELLAATARECGADLVVMGAYSHSRIREVLFGGCTQAFIRHADRPVLLVH
jgi:nucleotide-binding universal stress UspA family protein